MVKNNLKNSLQLKPRVLVVGGSGFIGRAVCVEFSNLGFSVISASRSVTQDNRWSSVFLDLTDARERLRVVKQYEPEIVILLAWETKHKLYWENASNISYMEHSTSFAKECLDNGARNLVGIGSMSEYGYNPGKCLQSNSYIRPDDLYSKMKIQTCSNLEQVVLTYGCKGNWIRLFHPYGPGEAQERLIPEIVKKMKSGSNLKIMNPNHVLDFTFVQDVARGIAHIVTESFPFKIDIGTGVPTSIKTLVENMAEILNYPVSKVDYARNLDNERVVYLDKDSEIFSKGWKPKLSLSESLESYIKSM